VGFGAALRRLRRLALALALLWHRTPPSVGVLDRLSRWRPQGRRGAQCGRR
jgi:hypothetical protein